MLTREDMKDVAEEAAEKALSRMMLIFGVDTHDPKSLIRLQQDFSRLRKWGDAYETVQKAGVYTLVTTAVTGLLALLWVGIKSKTGM